MKGKGREAARNALIIAHAICSKKKKEKKKIPLLNYLIEGNAKRDSCPSHVRLFPAWQDISPQI
jgi:hypothetical protein